MRRGQSANERVNHQKLSPPRNGTSREPRRVLYVTDFHVDELLRGVVDYARKAGWELDAAMRFHGILPETEADGILAAVGGASIGAGKRVQKWLAHRVGCPVVRMIATELDLPYPAVEADYVEAGRLGARHLLELGHVNCAFYYAYKHRPDIRDVREAFESEVAAAGRRAYRLDFDAAHPGRALYHVPPKERHAWLARELSRIPKPLAVMGDDDRRGIDLLAACELAGLRVPEDVAILGCDNRWFEQGMARIPLSSVDINMRGVGRTSAAILDKLMRGGKAPTDVTKVPPIGVVARRSTATFVTDSPGITSAVVHLREHYREPLRMPELARRAGMSERRFELEFKRQVGRNAREELLRARLGCAARLLRDTDLKLEAIAVESGFGSAAHLCRCFAGAYTLSPIAWRQHNKGGAT